MDWNNLILELLYAVITTTVPILTVYLIKLLRLYFNKISTEVEQSVLNDTVEKTLELILSVVSSTSQTYVDSLKNSGKFDEEAQKVAFEKTKETILSILSVETKELLESIYDDIDEWLDVQIEATVRKQKN